MTNPSQIAEEAKMLWSKCPLLQVHGGCKPHAVWVGSFFMGSTPGSIQGLTFSKCHLCWVMMYFWCADSRQGPFLQLIVQQVYFEGLWRQAQHFPSDELASWSCLRELTCSELLQRSWEHQKTKDPHANLTLPLISMTLGKSNLCSSKTILTNYGI